MLVRKVLFHHVSNTYCCKRLFMPLKMVVWIRKRSSLEIHKCWTKNPTHWVRTSHWRMGAMVTMSLSGRPTPLSPIILRLYTVYSWREKSRHLDVLMNTAQNADWCQSPKQAIHQVVGHPINDAYARGYTESNRLASYIWNSILIETKCLFTLSYRFVLVTVVTYSCCNYDNAA